MAFEDALVQAQLLHGHTRQFDQGSLNYCTGFAARWIRYQLLGQSDAFWNTPTGTGKPPVFQPSLGNRYTLTAAGSAKVERIYNQKAEQLDADGINRAGLATQRYLERSLQKGAAAVRGPAGNQFADKAIFQSTSELCREVRCLAPQRALHISLQPASVSGTFHSTAAFRSASGKVSYFDPCMGEVTLDQDRFAEWWQDYYDRWRHDRTYSQFAHCVTKSFNGTADLVQDALRVRQSLVAASAPPALPRTPTPPSPPMPGASLSVPAASTVLQLDSATNDELLELEAMVKALAVASTGAGSIV
jgi:hypothetical protein